MAHRCAAAAADAGHGELPLDEIVRQLAEEAAVAAVMHRAARIKPPAMRVKPLSAQASQMRTRSISSGPTCRSLTVKQVQAGQT